MTGRMYQNNRIWILILTQERYYEVREILSSLTEFFLLIILVPNAEKTHPLCSWEDDDDIHFDPDEFRENRFSQLDGIEKYVPNDGIADCHEDEHDEEEQDLDDEDDGFDEEDEDELDS